MKKCATTDCKYPKYLQEWILLFRFELVGAKNLETACCLVLAETVFITLEKRKDVVDDDGLEVDLFLVV